MELSEIFYSLQGESSYTGLPCIFIRLAGCNLRCSYCDTTYAYEPEFSMNIPEILEEIKKYEPIKLVEVTGGEPLVQKDTITLLTKLIERNYKVLLETNNSISLSEISKEVVKIVDIKTLSSGMSEKMLWDNLENLTPLDELKFVMADKEDFDWALCIIEKYDLQRFQISFSPVFAKLESATLAEWILYTKLPIRMNVQLHKLLWEDKRGA